MKTAIQAVNQMLKKGGKAEELGTCVEALQAASMDYIKAKGVGTQVTGRGIERMDAALDICGLAADSMKFFISKERRTELDKFEEMKFGKVMTKNLDGNYTIDPVGDDLDLDDEDKNMDIDLNISDSEDVDILNEIEDDIELD